ncbi:amino acid deaminase [Microbacterium sp.]|uniref:amino acid deaminase n=1 Tax=Microbacterium sp. TaxID=51671 RepID=UPI003A8D792A
MSLVIPDPVIGAWTKGLPPRVHGLRLSQLAGAGLHLSDLPTPVFTLTQDALAHNEQTVFGWAASQGVLLAPHGKTTMAPALWQRLLDAGAWGISVATPWQVGVAVEAGVQTIFLCNDLTDLGAAAGIREALEADPELRVLCWTDSAANAARLQSVFAGTPHPLDVLVELGGAGGRTGARTQKAGLEVAHAIAAADGLRLAGVGGYEGAVGPDRSDESLARVDAFLHSLVDLHDQLAAEGAFAGIRPVLSAGGSAFPDRVATILRERRDQADIVLRSGAFQIHDDGHYTHMSPFGRDVDTAPLRSAMHVWARVLSRPEPELALLDAGRRDVPFDIDLPVPQTVAGEVTALNDQHAFLALSDETELAVGDVVRLGLSHPCTAFDKWRVAVLIDDPDAADPRVIGAVATCF